MAELTTIGEILSGQGAAVWGVCPFPPREALLPCRGLERLPKESKRVVIAAFPYRTPEQTGRNISRYAVVPDYHRVLREKLSAAGEKLSDLFGGTFVPFVDSSPIPEVACAVQAGLGVKGKNGLLITKDYGSYVFLGELVTDRELPCTPPSQGGCIGCGRCLAACPGQAISAGGKIDEGHCLSFITQKKGELFPWEEELIRQGGLLWGCDRCQEVCPHNLRAGYTSIPEFTKDLIPRVEREDIRPLCKERAFGFRGPKVLERNWEILFGGEKKDGG